MLVAFDFESEGIDPFPNYPPKPTMLGIYEVGKEPYYMSWGHPSGNNDTEEHAKEVLTAYWNDPEVELIAQNIAFDMAIAHKFWGLPLQRQGAIHDTMVQTFLLEPHATTFSLKPTAERVLSLPPEEQDAVRAWLVSNGVEKATSKSWGKSISKCPAEIVGPYCVGDVVRTVQLYEVHSAKVQEAGMMDAYHVEMQLIPVMLQSTFEGIYINMPELEKDIKLYTEALAVCEADIFKFLDVQPFNIDSDAELASVIDLKYEGLKWILTPTGKKSTSKANLEITLASVDGRLGALLQYRASVSTCLGTFMGPWYKQASEGDGRIRCQWNTTRSDFGGARTGRLSSSPSLMNIPTLASAKFAQAIKMRDEFLPEYPTLPNVRRHISAAPGNTIVSIDFSQQELRVLAHFEDGDLMKAFNDEPNMDMHQAAADMVAKHLDHDFSRKYAKTVAFSILYGSGVGKLAEQLSTDYETAKKIKAAYLTALPGIAVLQKQLTQAGKLNQPITTWGGRRYYVEKAKYSETYGRVQSFEYKLTNYLIQGSSADITKVAMIEYFKKAEHGAIRVCVHDQVVIEVPTEHFKTEARLLANAMMSPKLDVPLTVDACYGQNLHDVVDLIDY